MRAIRLLLLLLMLAVMPFQSWAGGATCAGGNAGAPHEQAFAAVAGESGGQAAVMLAAFAPDAADTGAAGHGDSDGSDVKDPAQGGADLAESLLPAAPLRFAAGLARAGAPSHRPGLLPDPDLPLQQRPPSA
ncbi:hypothetical protein ACKI2N_018760 [Cupriavidus sp. 30B13]|uniref:hypothetical protein n=1 Tax=Cupriavidus sp. 30B13 TaxID=3384241 RepID=UPI003B90F14C